MWYSMAISPVHFTVISTEHDWSLTSEQIQYTMDSFHRSSTYVLHSTVNFTKCGSKICSSCGTIALEKQVWGHVHNYERTCAVFQGRCLQHPIKDLAGVDFFDTRI
ncbi:hypothetical protein SELMODRAFT_432228 [Selaginella moellendorffii]|uniref:Uncharacterized protein n=1 Tax=Selaginella moellendorffii TaxID=88036 RepID=D8TFD1_SELML|nr:hypothetical protein SELMODRAFT_432228 [Selaginella moellendorffii]